jgi:hypothetical protein
LVPAKTAVQGCQGLPPLNGFERPGLRHMAWHGRDDKVDCDVDSRHLSEMPMVNLEMLRVKQQNQLLYSTVIFHF